jgi:hypothetical protein
MYDKNRNVIDEKNVPFLDILIHMTPIIFFKNQVES